MALTTPTTSFLKDTTKAGWNRAIRHCIQHQEGDASNHIGNMALEITKGLDIGMLNQMHFEEKTLRYYESVAKKYVAESNRCCTLLGNTGGLLGGGKKPANTLATRWSWRFSIEDTFFYDIRPAITRHAGAISNMIVSCGGTPQVSYEFGKKMSELVKYNFIWILEPPKDDKLSRKNINYYLNLFSSIDETSDHSKVRVIYCRNSEKDVFVDYGIGLMNSAVRLGCVQWQMEDIFELLTPVSQLVVGYADNSKYRKWFPFPHIDMDINESRDSVNDIFHRLPVASDDDLAIVAGDLDENIFPKVGAYVQQRYRKNIGIDRFPIKIHSPVNVYAGVFQKYDFEKRDYATKNEHDYLMGA